jgi:transposase
MHLTTHVPEDLQRLQERIAREPNAKRRDRFRCVLEALAGEQTLFIARLVGRSRKFVQHWVYQYRDHGLPGLEGRKHPGRRPKLTAEQEQQLKARLDAGPTDADGVCTLRGQDIRRILRVEFGVVYARNAVYDLLRRLNYSSLKPRPRHPKNDPAAMQQFLANAPLLSET